MARISGKKRRKDRKKIILIIGLLIAVLLIAASAVYLLMHNRKNQKISYRTDSDGNVASVRAGKGLEDGLVHLFQFLHQERVSVVDRQAAVRGKGQIHRIPPYSFRSVTTASQQPEASFGVRIFTFSSSTVVPSSPAEGVSLPSALTM